MASKKDMTIKIGAEQVLYTNISKSKDGYNSARMVAKVNEKEYMSVSYEWEGDSIPDFAMNLMSFMQANEIEVGVNEERASEYEEFSCKTCKEHNPELYDKDGKLIKKTGQKKEKCADDPDLEDE